MNRCYDIILPKCEVIDGSPSAHQIKYQNNEYFEIIFFYNQYEKTFQVNIYSNIERKLIIRFNIKNQMGKCKSKKLNFPLSDVTKLSSLNANDFEIDDGFYLNISFENVQEIVQVNSQSNCPTIEENSQSNSSLNKNDNIIQNKKPKCLQQVISQKKSKLPNPLSLISNTKNNNQHITLNNNNNNTIKSLNNNNHNQNHYNNRNNHLITNIYKGITEDYVGLPNQGSTCYLSSLIQVFFHLKKFRKSIFEKNVPFDHENPIFCLKLLFRDLQMKKPRRSTKYFTNSLGWNQKNINSSQDVTEFYKFLCNDVIKIAPIDIFEGEITVTTICNETNYYQTTKEIFHDIMISIENVGSITESLHNYLSPFILTGPYKRHQNFDEIRQISFSKFPSVLVIELKRFWFNSKTSKCEKLNSVVIFPDELDISAITPDFSSIYNSNYQPIPISNEIKPKYKLFAVIAHIGSLNKGHYVSFINPDMNDKWYEFDDNKVSRVEKDVAFNLCYGEKNMNAYMIFYVDMNKKDDLFTNKFTIPEYVLNFVPLTPKEPPKQFSMNDEEGFMKNILLVKSSFLNMDVKKAIPFEFGKSIKEIYQHVAESFKKDPMKIRIWECSTIFLENILDPGNVLTKEIKNIWFIQDKNEEEPYIIDRENQIIVFLSFFFPSSNLSGKRNESRLHYVGSFTFSLYDQIFKIYDKIYEKLNFFEIKLMTHLFSKDTSRILDANKSFIDECITSNGQFLVVQPTIEECFPFPLEIYQNFIENKYFNYALNNEKSKGDEFDVNYENLPKYDEVTTERDDLTFDLYLESMINKVPFVIFDIQNPEIPLAELVMRKKCSVDHFKEVIASTVGYNYDASTDSIFLFKNSDTSSIMKDYSVTMSLFKNSVNPTKLYFLLAKEVTKFVGYSMFFIKVQYHERNYVLLYQRNDKKPQIEKHLIENGIIPDVTVNPNIKLRYLLVDHSKIFTIFNDNDSIPNEKFSLLIENVPEYQNDADIHLLKVSQCKPYNKDLNLFGTPFIIGIKSNELCLEMKEKIASILHCAKSRIRVLIMEDDDDPDNGNGKYKKISDEDNVLTLLDGSDYIYVCIE
ncbi:hypothetical protein TRFO_19022 [Tritrichomonas foetus]|uniref:ubiquitinyl hydrolase 1 n=1 Tax=Tritrichomonas foetus TaxID=1144522 RepID=A0A1J4KP55_9EUKA|nr:hypothetical protein TRFO_19022 [Tritrichomonas foetus]|eukprot:OHT11486.1 hypothetical protein TRFO_19022 [Tritrichomonas foetus]